MPIHVILISLGVLAAALTVLCAWLFWRTRRLESLLETRHAFEEMLEHSASHDAPVTGRPLRPGSAPAAQSHEPESEPGEPEAAPRALENEMPALLLEFDDLPESESAAPAFAPARPPQRPVVLGVISHKGGSAKSTTAVELARSWADAGQEPRRILLVDTDPVQAAASLLGIEAPAPGTICATAQAGLHYVHFLPAGWPHPVRWPDAFLQDWDLVVVDTPSLQNPLTVQLLSLFDALLLTLTLEPASMRVLEQGAILLERRLDPRRQRLLGVLVTRFQPESALQTSLYSSLQREYVGILLPETIPASARREDPAQDPACQQAYQELADRLYKQMQPLKQRAGGQA